MQYLLEINEVENGWEILNTLVTKDAEVYVKDDFDIRYCRVDKDLYDYVNSLLKTWSYLIVLDKSKLGFEGSHITRYDISVKDLDLAGAKKSSLLKSKMDEIVNSWTVIDTIDLFSFLVCNNKLIEKGIILTDSNLEESYSKILETDKSLLDLFNMFVNLHSKFEVINKMYSEYKELEKSMINMSEEDLNNL